MELKSQVADEFPLQIHFKLDFRMFLWICTNFGPTNQARIGFTIISSLET